MPVPVRLGLIGLGAWGRRIAATLADLPGCRLSAVASRAADAGEHLAVDVPVHSDWRDLLAAGRAGVLDGIVVATPPAPRGEIAEACIDAGLPAYLEKPITVDAVEAERLSRLSDHRGVLLTAGHLHLRAPAFRALLDRVRADGGPVGDVGVTGFGGNHGPFRKEYRALMDYGPHDVSMIIAIAGAPPKTVRAARTRRGEGAFARTAEVIEAVLDFDRFSARCTVGNLFDAKARSLEVRTTRSVYLYDDLARDKATVMGADGASIALRHESVPPLSASLSRFGDMIRRGAARDPEFADAVTTMRVLDDIAATADKALAATS
jgi:predicted dehydrogenase